MTDRRVIILSLLITAILYANTIGGDFVFDDTFLVRDNTCIESFSNLVSCFNSGAHDFARPVRLLSFYLDTALFGKNTAAYHFSNIAYYFVFCALAYFLCDRLFHHRFISLAVTLLFITHPLHTEGVAYISGRKDVLGGIFSFASLICFLRYIRGESKMMRSLLLTVLFFLLAIGSKEIYLVLPFLFLALEYYETGSVRKHLFFYTGWFTAASLFLLYIILWRNKVLFDYFHVIPVYGHNQGINFPTAIKICGYIFYLNFFPFHLSADYSYNVIKRIDFLNPCFPASCLLLILCFLAAVYFRQKQKVASLGFTWMLISLLPVCQIIPYPEIISERSLILFSFGACLVIAALLSQIPKRYGIPLLIFITIAFSTKTVLRNGDWHDEFSLWRATASQNPECARARYNLGIALARHNQFRAAEKEFRASLAINSPALITVPDYSYDALLNLGNVYAFLDDFPKAKEMYRTVLKYDGNNELALRNVKIVEGLEKNRR